MHRAYIVAIVILVALGAMSVFTVKETQLALKLEFGKIKRSDYTPGLHFKAFWQDVLKFDSRIQTLDAEPQLYLTSEKKQVKVDSFVKWKVDNVEKFYTSTGGGNPRLANDRLGVVIANRLRDEFGKRTIQQVVSGERTEIMDQLRVSTEEAARGFGLRIVDARIKRVDLPESVSQSVYDRMAAERKQVAKRFRSEGEEQALREIRANADREAEIIIAEAQRDGQKIRGDGDARATRVYADAYSQDAEFYQFYRSLTAYMNSFHDRSDIMLLTPDTSFFKFFRDSSGTVGVEP